MYGQTDRCTDGQVDGRMDRGMHLGQLDDVKTALSIYKSMVHMHKDIFLFLN